MVDISELSIRQLFNAHAVYAAALPYGLEAAKAALMTVGDESSWLMYANDGSTTRSDVAQKWRDLAATSLNYPHDAVAGTDFTSADSIGLFQQRPMFDYGTVAELMDPVRSTVIFIAGNGRGTNRYFQQVPSNLTLAQKCQWVQGSEFPTGENYAPFGHVADQLIARFTTQTDWFDMATVQDLKTAITGEVSPFVAAQTAVNTRVAASLARIEAGNYPCRLIQNSDKTGKPTGGVYVIGAGWFAGVTSWAELTALVAAGLVSGAVTHLPAAAFANIQAVLKRV
jgi:hypothetical protein